MGRKRSLTETELFAAVERVVQEHGPFGMTIEAVAREAGVSKATVLYQHASKTELLQAFISQKIVAFREAVTRTAETESNPDRAWLPAVINSMRALPEDEGCLSSLFLSEALKPDNPCRDQMRAMMEEDLSRLRKGATDFNAALVALSAFHGLRMLILYNSQGLGPLEKDQALETICQMARIACAPMASEQTESGET